MYHFINIERISTFSKLVRVTCCVKSFIRNLQARGGLCEGIFGDLLVEQMGEASLAWCKYEQIFMVNEKHFENQNRILTYFVIIKGCIYQVLVSILKSYSFYKSNRF